MVSLVEMDRKFVTINDFADIKAIFSPTEGMNHLMKTPGVGPIGGQWVGSGASLDRWALGDS